MFCCYLGQEKTSGDLGVLLLLPLEGVTGGDLGVLLLLPLEGVTSGDLGVLLLLPWGGSTSGDSEAVQDVRRSSARRTQ